MSAVTHAIYSHAWMQKHPTPTNNSGDFHWHPGKLPSAIRATLTELATRSRGRPASVWILDSGYVAWARTFSAIAPSDRRKYTGLVATVGQLEVAATDAKSDDERIAPSSADRGPLARRWSASLPDLIGHMPLPDAGPYAGQDPNATAALSAKPVAARPVPVGPDAVGLPRPVDVDALLQLFDDRDPQVAGAVYHGGQALCHAAHDERLSGLFGALLSWLPLAERGQPRTGMFTENRAAIEAGEYPRATENFLHYLSGAWMCPAPIRQGKPGYAERTWRLVCELASSSEQTLPQLFEQLTAVSLSWDSADQLLAHLRRCDLLTSADLEACDAAAPSPLMAPSVSDAGWLWNRVLHYWGRGFLTGVSSTRLARLLALRIVADHLFHLDAPDKRALPGRYLRRLHYEALLPDERVKDLRAGLLRCIPSLSPNREVQLG